MQILWFDYLYRHLFQDGLEQLRFVPCFVILHEFFQKFTKMRNDLKYCGEGIWEMFPQTVGWAGLGSVTRAGIPVTNYPPQHRTDWREGELGRDGADQQLLLLQLLLLQVTGRSSDSAPNSGQLWTDLILAARPIIVMRLIQSWFCRNHTPA